MNKRVFRTGCALACALLGIAPLSARADVSQAGALSAGLIAPANASLKRALEQIKDNKAAPQDVAQANPVGTPQAPGRVSVNELELFAA